MNRVILSAIVGLLLAISPGFGNLVGSRSLVDLEQSADLILVGTASGVLQAGSATTFSIQAIRVLKGNASLAGSTLAVSAASGSPNLSLGGTSSGLWFLRQSANAWVLIPVVSGTVPLSMTFFPEAVAPIPSAYAYSPTAAISDKVASEICAAMESMTGILPLQFSQLQYGPLDELSSPVVALYYQRMSASVLVPQQIVGLSGQIRAGSGAALASSAQGASAFEAYPLENGILLLGIRDYFRSADAIAITTLGAIAIDTSKPSAFRRADAHALAAIHTTGTLPYLAALLDDSDSTLQIEAIGGLGSFANGLATQTVAGNASLAHLRLPPTAPYRTAETMANFAMGSQAIQKKQAAYLAFWKQWWLQQQGNLGF